MIPVSALFEYCEMMLRDVWGYIWGTAGVMWSAEKQANYVKQYSDDPNRQMSCKYGKKWAGHMVADCSGVMVYIWQKFGLKIAHGSNSIQRQYCGATQKAPVPGYAAFRVKGEDYHHIGIVCEDGMNVYEAKGTQAGFVLSAASSWDCFAPFKDVDYGGSEDMGQAEPLYEATVTTKNGNLNLRSGPGKSYPAFKAIPRGSTVEVLSELENGWDFIRWNNMTGYVSGEYLTPGTPTVTSPTIPEQPVEEPETPAEAYRWVVVLPCEDEEEARRIAEGRKGAYVVRAEKPPDESSND